MNGRVGPFERGVIHVEDYRNYQSLYLWIIASLLCGMKAMIRFIEILIFMS